jgi:hypothetical protein
MVLPHRIPAVLAAAVLTCALGACGSDGGGDVTTRTVTVDGQQAGSPVVPATGGYPATAKWH